MSLCAAGSQYSAFVTSARGQVFTNGYGAGGVLGHGSTVQQQQQQRGGSHGGWGLPDFAAVSGFSADDPLAMLFDGDDHPADARTPLMVDSLAGKQVTAIGCGAYHMGVVTSDSQLFMWGLNAMGQVRTDGRWNTMYTAAYVFVRRYTLTRHYHAHALNHTSLHVHRWPLIYLSPRLSNLHVIVRAASHPLHDSQLGTGDCVDRCAPVQISPCTGARVTKIACGASHTICMACTLLCSYPDSLPVHIKSQYPPCMRASACLRTIIDSPLLHCTSGNMRLADEWHGVYGDSCGSAAARVWMGCGGGGSAGTQGAANR